MADNALQQYISDSVIVLNKKMQHSASLLSNVVYDIQGRIPGSGFFVVTEDNMKYMYKHVILFFDAETLGNHLNIMMNKRKEDIICGQIKLI